MKLQIIISFRKWKKSLENIAFYIKIIYTTPSLILITIFSNSNFPKNIIEQEVQHIELGVTEKNYNKQFEQWKENAQINIFVANTLFPSNGVTISNFENQLAEKISCDYIYTTIEKMTDNIKTKWNLENSFKIPVYNESLGNDLFSMLKDKLQEVKYLSELNDKKFISAIKDRIEQEFKLTLNEYKSKYDNK